MKKLDLAIPAVVVVLVVLMGGSALLTGEPRGVQLTPLLNKVNDLVLSFRQTVSPP